MSSEIGAFDAKTHLSEYLERVSRGESFTITRRGVPLADLRPHEGGDGSLRDLVQSCRELRARLAADRDEFNILEAVREDRSR
jgi:prevent-host-death family protein